MDNALKKSQHKAEAAHRASAKTKVRRACQDTEHQAANTELCDPCQKIEQAHRQWLTALDVLEDLIFLYDTDFRILRCNQAYQQCAGIPYEQIIGQIYYEIFPKSAAPLHSSLAVLEGTTEKHEEEEVRIGDKIYRSRALSVKEAPGTHLYTVHTLEEITERKKIDADLKLFRTLLDGSGDAIEVIDPATLRFLDVNETECSDLGYSRKSCCP